MCFERASDLGLLYLQENDIASGSSNSSNNSTAGSTLNVNASGGSSGGGGGSGSGGGVQTSSSSYALSSSLTNSSVTPDVSRRMGAILEMALQRAPIVLIKAGKLREAVERYRIMLNAIETRATQSLRLTLSRQLAEVLLRGVSGTIYAPPFSSKSAADKLQGKRYWKPRKYTGRSLFTPRTEQEEVILLLLIAEALAVRDTVLSQSPEFKLARQHAMGNVTAVYDLLALATVRWGLVQLLNESFEKALKFSFGEQHVWRQYSLSLMAAEKHAHALRVLQESMKLTPSDPLPCLLASRLCYESLETVKQGLDYAQQALRREVKGCFIFFYFQPVCLCLIFDSFHAGLRPSRSQLFVGIGHQQLAIQATLKSKRDAYNKLALESLERAVQQDGNDHLAEYYLSLQYALINQLGDALSHIRFALALRMEHAPCLHLFALLLTASRRPREALGVIEDALHEFPDNLQLLHVKAHLQLHLEDAETALSTVQHMLAVWREAYEAQLTGEEEKHSDTKSGVHLVHSSQMSDKDSSKFWTISSSCLSNCISIFLAKSHITNLIMPIYVLYKYIHTYNTPTHTNT